MCHHCPLQTSKFKSWVTISHYPTLPHQNSNRYSQFLRLHSVGKTNTTDGSQSFWEKNWIKDSSHNDLKSHERSSQEHHPEELQPVRGGEGGWDHTLCRVLVLLKQSPWLLGTILDGSPLQHSITACWHSFGRPRKDDRSTVLTVRWLGRGWLFEKIPNPRFSFKVTTHHFFQVGQKCEEFHI